ncbi:DUF960 family protein [Pelosinus propionicus]|uniref:Uncharacterized protein n=1 Tax=Pelosinus propionicus DSM 13327 TaxID=1123291 RepID=A0A1I4JRM4_9FIRM|nr:DUF960 family protein [Pelosinus propionicus]SFL69192.1 protein of unknown function [Pelosinus propionicus DSM 13327]
MFEQKYATRLVASSVGVDIQVILWELIAQWEKDDIELDTLQVFELSIEYAGGEVFQKVVHRQEVPQREETFYYKTIRCPMDTVIWVLGSDEGAEMLFPNEAKESTVSTS